MRRYSVNEWDILIEFLLHPWAHVSQRVCASGCSSLCSHISKTTRPNFTKFSTHVIYGRGSVLLWRQRETLFTSGLHTYIHTYKQIYIAPKSWKTNQRSRGFVDDVTFSCNRANRPESKPTRMFRQVRQVAAPVRRQMSLFGRVRQVASSGVKSAVSDCILCKTWPSSDVDDDNLRCVMDTSHISSLRFLP